SNMVRTINTQEVPLEDQLSNQVYLYTRSDDRIRIVSNSFPPVGASIALACLRHWMQGHILTGEK
ncbi:hypothetical protein, partial [Bilophila wadsworthia]|uniref:hypothetical protein n=1 Tax=Bilophila wadsworthia TaxID=35833 RepID=UPI003C6C9EF9